MFWNFWKELLVSVRKIGSEEFVRRSISWNKWAEASYNFINWFIFATISRGSYSVARRERGEVLLVVV